MGFLTRNDQQAQQMSERQLLQNKFASARSNLLLVLVFTVVNIILLVTQSNTYFLFSAYVPYLLAILGMEMCGMFPDEYYGGDTSGFIFFDTSFLVIMLVIAAVILALYLLSFIFTKKGKSGWMIFALVLFAIDTVLMVLMALLGGFSSDMIMDYIFHAWVLYSLFSGVSAAKKLKALPEEPVVIDVEPVAVEPEEEITAE